MKIMINLFSIGLFAILVNSSLYYDTEAEAYSGNTEETRVQYEPESGLDPADEELDEVSEPVGELSEPPGDVPTETLDSVSETTDQASESINELTEEPENLDQDSESIDELGENLDQVSETAGEASEDLPIAPEGDGSGMEYTTDEAEMPLGDREAEGKGIGD